MCVCALQVNAAIDDIISYAEANRILCAAVRNNSSKLAPADRKRGHALLSNVSVGASLHLHKSGAP